MEPLEQEWAKQQYQDWLWACICDAVELMESGNDFEKSTSKQFLINHLEDCYALSYSKG